MLSSTFVRSKAGLVPVVLAALILAACSGRAPQTPPPTNIQDEASANSDYYLQQLQQSSDDNKADWQLLAIRALLREGKLPQAAEQLGTLPANMSGTQRQEQQLLTAELLVAQKNNPAATDILGKLDATQLSANQQVRFYQAQIAANQGKATLPLIRAFIAQEPLLKDKAHQDNIDGTWQGLAQLTPQELNNIIINADENVLQGWLDLLHVYQDNKQDPDLLKAGIKDWQNRYPQNPAAKNLPTALTQVSNFSQASTAKIALLLPLSGSAQVFADAIQQGFTAAQNGLPVNTPAPVTPDATATTPTDATATPVTDIATPAPVANPVATSNAQVKIYDTTTQPVAALLAQAQQDGATLVVGPLLKAEVEQLSTPPSTLNILALNQPEVSTNSQNICYFALSPEDEARDAAHHLWSQEKRMPLLLTPRGAFGDRVAKAFAEEWQKQGGQTVLQQNFGSTAELKQTINSGAGIRLAGQPVSVSSAPASVTIAGLTIPAPQVDAPVVSTSAGGNIDAVYIIATPAELTLIKPMIDMATSTRSKPALFASSRSYQAGAGPDYRLEMEGIQFSDIPLMAGANPALMQQAAAKFANDYSLVRLYAMGIDAWTLSNHFAEMRQIPGFQVSGTTGDLTASADCVITRKLPWLQYRQGMVVPAA
ncbi:penicillin-binding protein activator [Yersinia enterocolitica]|uniref:penicillin-binding protein activator n=1 Tax=Yersinia enterocolitica TaxID=630 RepID=UPI001EFE3B28|nr:penicillin-binding protein activator [Yersinia enterocolitica]MCG9161979.1 penicillin-binding protein activator [Yersinia enterocolitica]MCG9185602.1 penicillin-binding protein activator [Yersinia enterocolitica]MCG9189655.1 penicillin-binding protein activator [Yersinia enterocolitica]MCG9193705.1 penicillin-binding protein activator [Yersinia enterocolitica]MCG9197769.1 penicillin-binding protein activator [Yersinia enterocolitica]